MVLSYRPERSVLINALRNSAVASTTTDFVCALDVDFLPSMDSFCCFYGTRNVLPALFGEQERVGLIVPQMIIDDHECIPRGKDQLREMLTKGSASPYCLIAQSGMNFKKWPSDTSIRAVVLGPQSEPFIILRRSEFVPFDERFVGYGFNKVRKVSNASLAKPSLGPRKFSRCSPFSSHALHATAGVLGRCPVLCMGLSFISPPKCVRYSS